MGSVFSPPKPKLPDPPPPPPTPEDPAVQEARRQERLTARRRRGLAATILTGGEGDSGPVGNRRKALLGE